ncbi:imidazole glycerol phosphate synthase subunit HisH [Henriciella aquimarina]|uniref:imidazole glycerol phosphate synthase subunit HisH n=1 Tax=Henriciella aquimarina TaxID=545261 RepID=UPI000A0161EF|nr:imidazole glycerol phosphate synthase subunit HisH [Henriciella aquimarina]
MAYLALIDYGSGNLHSAERALRTAASASGAACEIHVTADADMVRRADRIVLPGVGHYADCAKGLRAVPGLEDALGEAVIDRAVPFFGICVGMQLMADRGLEDGETPGFGWIQGDVDRIKAAPGLPVPHMGWNGLQLHQDHPVLQGLGEDPHVYFTHSYAMQLKDNGDLAASTDYGAPITAVIARDNMVGTQFHPEKSQRVGLQMLANFMAWRPV